MMTYRTKQRDILMDAILSYEDVPFTAEELLVKLINQKNRVSKATVYRTLDMLESEGNIRKYYVQPQESAFYQYIGDHKDRSEERRVGKGETSMNQIKQAKS